MPRINRIVSTAAVAAVVFASTPVHADDDGLSFLEKNRYVVTNLTSDIPGVAPNTDPVLQNAWGVVFTPAGSPFWVSDNATGCSTLYDGMGVPQPTPPLQVKIPLPGGVIPSTACKHADPNNPPNPTPAAPTGLVWNPSPAFLVPNTQLSATFLWDTEDGTISAWTSGLTPPDQAAGLSHMALALERGRCGGGDIAGVSVFDPALRPPYGRIRRLLCRNRGPTTEQCPPRST